LFKILRNSRFTRSNYLFDDEAVLPNRYENYVFEEGLFAQQFPIKEEAFKGRHFSGKLGDDIVEISDHYSSGKMWNAGVMRHGIYYTYDTEPVEEDAITLNEIIQPESEVNEKYYLSDKQIEQFKYLRGPKKLERTSASGHSYFYSEGGMSPSDNLNLPGRTMLTSEGSVNRSTHILEINNRLRFLTPIEAERMQDFPDNWTQKKKNENGEIEKVEDSRRLFFMGNALVTEIVKRVGDELAKQENIYNV